MVQQAPEANAEWRPVTTADDHRASLLSDFLGVSGTNPQFIVPADIETDWDVVFNQFVPDNLFQQLRLYEQAGGAGSR